MRVALLVPARDEAPRIGRVLRELRLALPHARAFVVDSGSRDDTAERARAEGATVIPQGGSGYAGALATGYRHIAPLGYDALVQLDADGQHPPGEAPRLLAALHGADLVVGSRHGTRSGGPLDRRLGNALLAATVRGVAGLPLRDVTSGYQALDHRAILAFARRFPQEVADANVRVYAARLGLRVVELPVTMGERAGGRSMHAGLAGVRNLGRSLLAVWEERRR